MNEFKNDINESCSSNLLFLRENNFQVDVLIFDSKN